MKSPSYLSLFRNLLVLFSAAALALFACGTNARAPVSPSKEPPPRPTMPPSLTPSLDSSATPTSELSASPATWWRPQPAMTWQWQIGDNDIDSSIPADVYDVDLYVDQVVIDELHALGRKIICYISVGSWEDWRPDKDQFPPEVLGNDYDGWPGEKWLDIRQIDRLAPILRARFDLCKAKGFDAIEPDNMEIYANETGFPLTYADQLKFTLWLAEEAHARGLAIGQKNASDQTAELVSLYDFAIIEDAFYYDWAKDMLPYIKAGKPVFAAEYTDLPGKFAAFCEQSKQLGFSTILKNRGLDAWLQNCP